MVTPLGKRPRFSHGGIQLYPCFELNQVRVFQPRFKLELFPLSVFLVLPMTKLLQLLFVDFPQLNSIFLASVKVRLFLAI